MTNRLLDRQVDLLAYLTSGEAIFRTEDRGPMPSSLEGMNRRYLDQEARFSHEKRMKKIRAVFPMTFALLGASEAASVRSFVDAYPPSDISRIANARQFHQFLCDQRRKGMAQPPHLRDIADCELACATIVARYDEDRGKTDLSIPVAAQNSIRRRPDIVLVRCGHDIRTIFEGGDVRIIPEQRETSLAIAIQQGNGRPGILEIQSATFDFLAALDDWTAPDTIGTTPIHRGLIKILANHGLIEVHL